LITRESICDACQKILTRAVLDKNTWNIPPLTCAITKHLDFVISPVCCLVISYIYHQSTVICCIVILERNNLIHILNQHSQRLFPSKSNLYFPGRQIEIIFILHFADMTLTMESGLWLMQALVADHAIDAGVGSRPSVNHCDSALT